MIWRYDLPKCERKRATIDQLWSFYLDLTEPVKTGVIPQDELPWGVQRGDSNRCPRCCLNSQWTTEGTRWTDRCFVPEDSGDTNDKLPSWKRKEVSGWRNLKNWDRGADFGNGKPRETQTTFLQRMAWKNKNEWAWLWQIVHMIQLPARWVVFWTITIAMAHFEMFVSESPCPLVEAALTKAASWERRVVVGKVYVMATWRQEWHSWWLEPWGVAESRACQRSWQELLRVILRCCMFIGCSDMIP